MSRGHPGCDFTTGIGKQLAETELGPNESVPPTTHLTSSNILLLSRMEACKREIRLQATRPCRISTSLNESENPPAEYCSSSHDQ
jgi:hypothetical protein